MTTSISEIQILPEMERRFRARERLEEFYSSNADWSNALACKWAMAALSYDNPLLGN